MKKHIALLLLSLMTAVFTARAGSIRVEPNETVELMSVIMMLSGAEEYNSPLIWPEYKELVEKRFAEYKDHAAVKFVRKLRRKGYHINYDSPMVIAVNSQIRDGKVVQAGEKSAVEILRGKSSLSYWNDKTHRKFMDAVSSFYEDSRFAEFFSENRKLYAPVQHSLGDLYDKTMTLNG